MRNKLPYLIGLCVLGIASFGACSAEPIVDDQSNGSSGEVASAGTETVSTEATSESKQQSELPSQEQEAEWPSQKFADEFFDKHLLREYPGCDGSTYRFLYDQNGIFRLKASNGENTYTYSYTNGLISRIDTPYGPIDVDHMQGELIGITYDDVNYSFTYDWYNVQSLYNEDGDMVVHYVYDEKGHVTTYEVKKDGTKVINDDPAFVGNVNPFLYGARYDVMYDCFTGLYYELGVYTDPDKQILVVTSEYADEKAEPSDLAQRCNKPKVDVNDLPVTEVVPAWEYGDNQIEMVINRNKPDIYTVHDLDDETTFDVHIEIFSPYEDRKIDKLDLDGDGEVEYIFYNRLKGNFMGMTRVIVVKPGQIEPIVEYSSDTARGDIDHRMTDFYDETTQMVDLQIDSVPVAKLDLSDYMDKYGWIYNGYGLSQITHISLEDGKFIFGGECVLYTKGKEELVPYGWKSEAPSLKIKATVNYAPESEYGFTVGDIYVQE